MHKSVGPRATFRRRIRDDHRGVAAVIGAILALVAFLAVLGIFLSEYLPLWMTENEQELTATVANQFGEIKQSMDSLYQDNNTGFAIANPVTMVSASVPIFAQPTQGILSYTNNGTNGITLNTSVAFRWVGHSVGLYHLNQSGGMLKMYLPNRYYAQVTYALENDAVISSQNAMQQILFLEPNVAANFNITSNTLYLTLFSTYGNTTAMTSFGTGEVYVTALSSQHYNSPVVAGSYNPVYYNISTFYPCAWANYWNATARYLNSTSPSSSYYVYVHPLSGVCSGSTLTKPSTVRVYFPKVYETVVTVVTFEMNVGGNPK